MVSLAVVAAAFASTGLISLAPNLLLFLFPQASNAPDNDWLSIGQALAAGGLLGDVFLHVVPHSAGMSENAGLWILLGFSIFLVVDMIVRSTSSSSGHGHSHSHHHNDGAPKTKKKNIDSDGQQQINLDHNNSHTSTVLLNLAADALHNFTDGLAIGASFAYAHASGSSATEPVAFSTEFSTLLKSRGGLATLSILFHEIPHELGDYATLIKEGYSKRSAITAQFMTAIAALIGTGVGLIAHDYAGDRLIFVTAGGFVYLACVTMLPHVMDETTVMKNRKNMWGFRVKVIIAFGLGIGFLHTVSLLEEMDESGHGHSHSHSHHSHGHHRVSNTCSELDLDNAHDHHDHGHHDHHESHNHHDHNHDNGHDHHDDQTCHSTSNSPSDGLDDNRNTHHINGFADAYEYSFAFQPPSTRVDYFRDLFTSRQVGYESKERINDRNRRIMPLQLVSSRTYSSSSSPHPTPSTTQLPAGHASVPESLGRTVAAGLDDVNDEAPKAIWVLGNEQPHERGQMRQEKKEDTSDSSDSSLKQLPPTCLVFLHGRLELEEHNRNRNKSGDSHRNPDKSARLPPPRILYWEFLSKLSSAFASAFSSSLNVVADADTKTSTVGDANSEVDILMIDYTTLLSKYLSKEPRSWEFGTVTKQVSKLISDEIHGRYVKPNMKEKPPIMNVGLITFSMGAAIGLKILHNQQKRQTENDQLLFSFSHAILLEPVWRCWLAMASRMDTSMDEIQDIRNELKLLAVCGTKDNDTLLDSGGNVGRALRTILGDPPSTLEQPNPAGPSFKKNNSALRCSDWTIQYVDDANHWYPIFVPEESAGLEEHDSLLNELEMAPDSWTLPASVQEIFAKDASETRTTPDIQDEVINHIAQFLSN
mmetsp:Transcript_15018/g.36942  ORF Transcript_15018/g.36942 Transcript_15018/m.36942 type:complete len:874 (-) Transcript_15018:1942-4563(-)